MNILTCKVTNYNENFTIASIVVPKGTKVEDAVDMGRKLKKLADMVYPHLPTQPNVVRFYDEAGKYSWDMQQIVRYV